MYDRTSSLAKLVSRYAGCMCMQLTAISSIFQHTPRQSQASTVKHFAKRNAVKVFHII